MPVLSLEVASSDFRVADLMEDKLPDLQEEDILVPEVEDSLDHLRYRRVDRHSQDPTFSFSTI